jgi:L-2-hydroxyglutarate oxidase LhgO
MTRVDVIVIGGGIVGLSAARALLRRRPGLRLLLLEKEPALAAHQTSHNSGVIHSGIYYAPGSLKARLCVAGARRLVEFCRERGVPFALTGKVIVAACDAEVPRLTALHERGQANGVPGLALLEAERLAALEPHARGVAALHVPGAGVVDYRQVAEALARDVQEGGGEVRTGTRVTGLRREAGEWRVETPAESLRAGFVLSCAGLHADRVARASGGGGAVCIAPFRGEYHELSPARRGLVRTMIYPVPDPALPFLGVHFTRGLDGAVHVGPNAVLALAREGYRRSDWNLRDCWDLARFPGTWGMARRVWRMGVAVTWRALSRAALVREAQRLVPEVRAQDLVPGGSGVRAQALGRDGALLDDFDVHQAPGALHVRNVPSPAATACRAVAEHLADLAEAA